MDNCSSNISVACSYLHQRMMTKRSTHAFKGVMMTVFGRQIDRQGAFSTVITSVIVMLNTGILLPTSCGNVQHPSWFWQRMVHSRSQLGRPETSCCTLMNPEALDRVAHSGWAMSWQENCPHKGKRCPVFPPTVAAVPEEPTAPFSEESFQLYRQCPWERALCVQQWQKGGWIGWTGSKGVLLLDTTMYL